MINFFEKILSDKISLDTLEKSQKRVVELELAISQIIGILAEHQRLIERISENQNVLVTSIVSAFSPLREEDLN